MQGGAVASRENAWYLRTGAWVGVGTGPGALMTGGGIAEVRGPVEIIGAIVVGAGFVAALSVAHGILGQRLRAPTVGIAERAFGAGAGARVVALLIVAGVTTWNGFYLGVAAGTLGSFAGVSPVVFALPLALLTWRIYAAGFHRWNLLVMLTALTALGVAVVTVLGIPQTAAVVPPAEFSGTTLLLGASTVVAYAAVFAVRAPDFTSDAPRPSDVVRNGVAMFATLATFLGLGAWVYLRTGGWNLADLVNRTAEPATGALLLVASAIAPCVSGLHSGALGYGRLFGWSPAKGSALIATGAALLGAARFDLLLLPFLGALGAVVPPVVAVLLLRGGRHRDADAWVAWAVGCGTAAMVMLAGLPAHVLAGMAAAAAVLLISPTLHTAERSPAR